MSFARLPYFALSLVGMSLLGQAHSHPAVNSNHNHRNNLVAPGRLHFGSYDVPQGYGGTITMGGATGTTPMVSPAGAIKPTATVARTLATYYIDLQIADLREKIWATRDRTNKPRTVTLTRTTGSETVSCTLEARSYPWWGFYTPFGSASARSQDFTWGGTVTITAGQALVSGTYTGNTSALNTSDTNFDGSYAGFVLTEDWCEHYTANPPVNGASGANYNYGTSSESPDFPISIRLDVIRPLALTTTSSLHFGTFVRPAAAGKIRINPTDGTRQNSVAGSTPVTLSGASPTHSRAIYNLSGQTGRIVDITIPATTTIRKALPATDTMSVAFEWAIAGTTGTFTGTSGSLTLSSADPGVATMRLGGTLTVPANQATGVYSGTYDITFAYR